MVLLFLVIAYTREKVYGYEKISIEREKNNTNQVNIYQLDRFSVQDKHDGYTGQFSRVRK